jgi:putative flavoprotein involved in K+ transport
VPVLSADLSDDVLQLHSSLYRSPRQLPSGRVLVVGGGNSGVQIAAELAATRQVILAVDGRPQMVPQRLAGRDLFWWLTNLGLLRKPAGSRIARRIRARGELVIGTSWRQLRTAGVDLRPRVVSAISRRVRFAGGTTATVDAVVWATGYRTDHSWIDVPGAVADGTITHTRDITPADGLYVLGMPWQHTAARRCSASSTTTPPGSPTGSPSGPASWPRRTYHARLREDLAGDARGMPGPGSVPSLRC